MATITSLGPNSALLNYSKIDTQFTVAEEMTSYITQHGWGLYDTVGSSGTPTQVRVFRALQQGSTSVYKYVAITLSTTTAKLEIFKSWSITNHSGSGNGSYVNSNLNGAIPFTTGVDGYSLGLFVSPYWLAIRPRTNTQVFLDMQGSFEIKKEFGEDPLISTNIFMSTAITAGTGNSSYGWYGSFEFGGTPTVNTLNTLSTARGIAGPGNGGGGILDYMPTGITNGVVIPNGALTITAATLCDSGSPVINKLRGRILGLKLVYGTDVWNDMDIANVKTDDDYFHATNGTSTPHYFMCRAGNYLRLLLPA